MREVKKNKPPIRKALCGAFGILLVGTIMSSVHIVPEGHVGVLYTMGRISEDNIAPGPLLSAPIVQYVDTVDVREQIYEVSIGAYTKDTQTIEAMDIALTYSYNSAELPHLIRNVGIRNVESKLIVPLMNSVPKNHVGMYKAEELVQNRARAQESIEEELREHLAEYGIQVHSFNIKDINFLDVFEEAVNRKVQMEQEAQTAANETALRQAEADQIVIAAEAEAEASKLKADAEAYAIKVIQQQLAKSPNYVELQKIEKWNGQFPTIMGDTINPFVSLKGEELQVWEP